MPEGGPKQTAEMGQVRLPNASGSSTIGYITLGPKQTGAPSAGNLHAGCDVAGAGDGFTVWLVRHSQRKRGETARLDLRNTAPVLIVDPETKLRIGITRFWKSTRQECPRGFSPPKTFVKSLFERASRCYELPVLTHDVLVESFEQRDALGSGDEYSEAVCS